MEPEVRLVEESDGGVVEEARRKVERDGRALASGATLLSRSGRVVSLHEHGAPERSALGERVDPGDRVLVVPVGRVDGFQRGIEVAKLPEVDDERIRVDALEPERSVEDDA